MRKRRPWLVVKFYPDGWGDPKIQRQFTFGKNAVKYAGWRNSIAVHGHKYIVYKPHVRKRARRKT